MADEVLVPVRQLEQIKSALATAFYQSQATDLLESYRKLQDNAKWSPMTTLLSNQMDVIQSYIDMAKERRGGI